MPTTNKAVTGERIPARATIPKSDDLPAGLTWHSGQTLAGMPNFQIFDYDGNLLAETRTLVRNLKERTAAQANAHLMASAPSLFNALRQVQKWLLRMDAKGDIDPILIHDWIKQVLIETHSR